MLPNCPPLDSCRNQRRWPSTVRRRGPTLAYWLLRRGFTPTIVEQAPSPRSGGYVIDFWGLGWEVAERMGLTPLLRRDGYRMNEVRLVNKSGRPVARLDAEVFRAAAEDRFISIHRGDLARIQMSEGSWIVRARFLV